MKTTRMNRALAAAMAMLLAAGPALADRDKWDDDDHGHRDKHERYEERHDDRHGDEHADRRFHDHDRVVIHDYYEREYGRGHCPPGLAKKHNGCIPPGHDRRWEVGRPLPPEVVYYPLPPEVVVELGPPPPHHRYVRVAGDILLIAVGTGMVVDAINDLDR